MEKTIEIPEGYEARIEGNKVILEPKESKDERIRTRLIALVEAFGQGTYKDEMLTYLEKQKEQKPAEWSEEDEALLKEIVSFFKDGTTKLQHDLDLYAGFLENKLKSLRPQPHWKPSEEQMEALKEAVYQLDGGEYSNGIDSLINDLQKLL